MIGAHIHSRATEAALFAEGEKLSTLAGTTADDRTADPGESSPMFQDFAVALQELIAPNQKDDSSESSSKEGIYAPSSAIKSRLNKTNDQATSTIQAKLPASSDDSSTPRSSVSTSTDQPLADDRQPNLSIYRNEHAAKSFETSFQSESGSNKAAGLVNPSNNSFRLTYLSTGPELQTSLTGSTVEPHTTAGTISVELPRPATKSDEDLSASKIQISTIADSKEASSGRVSENQFVSSNPTTELPKEDALHLTGSVAITNLTVETKSVWQSAASAHPESATDRSATSQQRISGSDSHSNEISASDSTDPRSINLSNSFSSKASTGLISSAYTPSIAQTIASPVGDEPKTNHRVTTSSAESTTKFNPVSVNVSREGQRTPVTLRGFSPALESRNSNTNPSNRSEQLTEITATESPKLSVKTANTTDDQSSWPVLSRVRPDARPAIEDTKPESAEVKSSTIDTKVREITPAQQPPLELNGRAPHIASKHWMAPSSPGVIVVNTQKGFDKASNVSSSADSRPTNLREPAAGAPDTYQTSTPQNRPVTIGDDQPEVAASVTMLFAGTSTTERHPTANINRPKDVAAEVAKTSRPYVLSKNNELSKGAIQVTSTDARPMSGGLAPTVSFGARHSNSEAQTRARAFEPLEVTQTQTEVTRAAPYSNQIFDGLKVTRNVNSYVVEQPTINRTYANAANENPIQAEDSTATRLGVSTNTDKTKRQASINLTNDSRARATDHPIQNTNSANPVSSSVVLDAKTVSTSAQVGQRAPLEYSSAQDQTMCEPLYSYQAQPDGSLTTSSGPSKVLLLREPKSSELAEEPKNGSFALENPSKVPASVPDRQSEQIPQSLLERTAASMVVQSAEPEKPADSTRRESNNSVDSLFPQSILSEQTASDTSAGTPTTEGLHLKKDETNYYSSAPSTEAARTNTKRPVSSTESYPRATNFAEALPPEGHTNASTNSSTLNTQLGKEPAAASSQVETGLIKGPNPKSFSDNQRIPSVANSTLFGTDTARASSIQPTAQAESIRIVQDATQLVAPARIANLSVENAEGETTHAILRERAGAIDVKIVTSSNGSAQRIVDEIDTMRQNFDAAGLRLGHSEVSYQDGAGQRRDENYKPATSATRSNDKQQAFTLNEVVE